MGWFARPTRGITAALTLFAAAGVANADPLVRNLGGGWQVTIQNSDLVDVVTNSVDDDILVVERSAEFIDIDPQTAQPAPAILRFQQIRPDALTTARIIIDDDLVLNHTGQNWTSFHNMLIDSGQVMFNQPLSSTLGVSSFSTRTFNLNSTEVTFAGGVVPAGAQWAPGATYIDVNLSNLAPVSFTLSAMPVPEPASGLLILAGALLTRAFRRG